MSALSNAISTASPYLYFKCGAEDGAYSIGLDSSPTKRHITAYPSWVSLCAVDCPGGYKAHKLKQRASLSGATPGDYGLEMRTVLIPDPLQNVGDQTILAIVKFYDLASNAFVVSIDDVGEDANTNILNSLWFYVNSGALKFNYYWEYGSGSNVSGYLGPALPMNEFFFVVARRTAATKTITLYVNGTSYSATYTENPTIAAGPLPWLKVGGSRTSATTNPEFDICHLSIFNSALSDAKILSLYNAWLSDKVTTKFTLEGIARLNGTPVAADVSVYESVSGAFRAKVKSSAVNGYYKIEDTSGAIMGAGEKYFLLCNYGEGVRPLAHGPVTPVATAI